MLKIGLFYKGLKIFLKYAEHHSLVCQIKDTKAFEAKHICFFSQFIAIFLKSEQNAVNKLYRAA